MLWGGASSERVRLEHPGEGTHLMHQEIFELNCSRTSLALESTLVVVSLIRRFVSRSTLRRNEKRTCLYFLLSGEPEIQRSGNCAFSCSRIPVKILRQDNVTNLSGDVNSQKARLHKGMVFADHEVPLKRCCKFEDVECYED